MLPAASSRVVPIGTRTVRPLIVSGMIGFVPSSSNCEARTCDGAVTYAPRCSHARGVRIRNMSGQCRTRSDRHRRRLAEPADAGVGHHRRHLQQVVGVAARVWPRAIGPGSRPGAACPSGTGSTFRSSRGRRSERSGPDTSRRSTVSSKTIMVPAPMVPPTRLKSSKVSGVSRCSAQ